ncbi:ATP-dependent DNA ligase [Enhygromyxa salina]|uniref:ATP-dependent DNA ligase n=1 Tax=Enhygromyxa salina TaxID=215803 RepID=A0A0C2CRJ0_9BACT|nr:WGR domain-containing protein [Enhygromyxa salina]KIG13791.1 ATP-dependent DNA ligase [Enhygromyxa salina]
MTVVRSIQLFFQEGKSDKVYNATLLDDGGGVYSVEVEWGRRGAKLSRGKKAVKVPLAAAEKAFARLVHQKTSKGYEELTEVVRPQAVAPPEGEGSGSRVTGGREKVGQGAQLLNAIDPGALAGLILDDRVIAQQKLDGNRVLVHVDETIRATNRAGQLTTIHASILAALDSVPQGTVIDGELMSGADGPSYWLFDVLKIGGEDLRGLGYLERWERLDAEIEPAVDAPIRILEYAQGQAAKQALYDRLVAGNAEGIVFKRVNAVYTSGRPSSGGDQLKHKFIKSADVVILENAGNAYRMGVYAGGVLREVGKVFAGTTNESRADLDARLSAGEQPVAEVRYLYATDDEQLYQPVFIRLRDDKPGLECGLDQLEKTRRDVHEH